MNQRRVAAYHVPYFGRGLMYAEHLPINARDLRCRWTYCVVMYWIYAQTEMMTIKIECQKLNME